MEEEFAPRVNDLSWRLSSLNLGSSEPLSRSGADRRAYECEPVVAVGFESAGDAEDLFLQAPGDGARLALADLDAIDRANGGDFDGRAGEEDLVHDVQHLARDDLFFHRDVDVFAEGHHSRAGDSGQNTAFQRGSVHDALMDQEHVHARAFAEVA